ncbi:hypothetical protein [Burkholderia sp. Bp9140]|uniref:hypothetical protein n=1 Tax=Burkholderia sp. Bp9140 TaxID=2184572 RepID=UPI0016265A0C|nr:hypothetical protein [Burkholderia sp. Bp9140]
MPGKWPLFALARLVFIGQVFCYCRYHHASPRARKRERRYAVETPAGPTRVAAGIDPEPHINHPPRPRRAHRWNTT